MLCFLEKNVLAFGSCHAGNVIELVQHFQLNIDSILEQKKRKIDVIAEDDFDDYFGQSVDPTMIVTLANRPFSSWFKFTAKPNLIMEKLHRPQKFVFENSGVQFIPDGDGIYGISVLQSENVGPHVLRGKNLKQPECKGWHVGKKGFPTMRSKYSYAIQPKNCELCPKWSDCKKSSYKIVFLSGYVNASVLGELADADAFISTGEDLGLPLRSEMKDNYIYATMMGILEARGEWGYNLFYKTKLNTPIFGRCKISAFSKQNEESYFVVDKTIDVEKIDVDVSCLQKIFTAVIRPLQNRAMRQKLLIETVAKTPEPPKFEEMEDPGDPPF